MNTQKVMDRDNKYIMHTYGRSPIVIERGEGMTAIDADGKRYLDFTSGIGVNALGYAHPAWLQAVTEQAARVQHTSNLYYTAPCGRLARRICHRTGLDRVFFGNSGAEANEGAIKCARKYSVDTYGEGRSKVITLVNSFHGRTLATLTATGQDVFHHDFGPFPGEFAYVPAGDFAALEAAADEHTCAVMMELVQGEGGVVALDPDYVHGVAEFCAAKDILLIVDEVQTGVGRTGKFLACENYHLRPDIVTLAKGLGGGLPIGAVVTTEKVASHMGPGSHGSTFGGNPVVCAGACAVLDTMDEEFMQNVNDCAAALWTGLRTLPHVQGASGLGLMIGIQLDEGLKAAEVRTACEKQGLLVLTAGQNVLRLLPPLTIRQEELDQGLEIMRSVLCSL